MYSLLSLSRTLPRLLAVGALVLPSLWAPQSERPEGPEEQLTEWMEEVVASELASAVLVRTGDGWSDALGVSDLDSGDPADPDGHFRIASVTKMFVATVVLQLAEEGELGLDDTVEEHLPGLVPNGGAISVRQVLNHTSGLYNHSSMPGYRIGLARGEDRYTTHDPEELVALATEYDPYFPPGEGWHYSNTNYLVAGLLVEELTGTPYAEQVARRVLEPLGLDDTSVPGTDHRVPEPHARAYHRFEGEEGYTDVSEYNPTIGWASGEMLSTTADLERFLDALLGGELLSDESLEEMTDTVDTGQGSGYGLGIREYELPCGVSVLGHGGSEAGYQTSLTMGPDGRVLVLNASKYRLDQGDPEAENRAREIVHCP